MGEGANAFRVKLTVHATCITLLPESQLEFEVMRKWEKQEVYFHLGTMHCVGHGFPFAPGSSVHQLVLEFHDPKPKPLDPNPVFAHPEPSPMDFLNHSERELLLHIAQTQTKIMATLKDIQDQNTALLAAVQAEDSVVDSAVVLINGFSKQLSDLQAQLAAAIAGNDPTAIQAVSDSMASTVSDINAKTTALSTAVAANTAPTAS